MLTIDETSAKALFATSTPEFRKTLIDTFGSEVFLGKITDRVKTFEDALKIADITFNADGTPDEIAYKKLKIIVKTLNEGWVPDWNSLDRKYLPLFEYNDTIADTMQFNFVKTTTAPKVIGTHSGLLLKSQVLAEYAGTQFIELYRDLITTNS